MVDYSIKAYPTVYRGRQYRSRLEARWAAFFDALGLRHEYEPFDLGKWSPDFLLPDINLLVEIKPLSAFDEVIWDKIAGSCGELPANEESIGRWVLLTRTAPVITGSIINLGWLGGDDNGFSPTKAMLGWIAHNCRPEYEVSVIGVEGAGWYSTAGHAGSLLPPDPLECPHSYHDYGMELWARASNAVQWKPPA